MDYSGDDMTIVFLQLGEYKPFEKSPDIPDNSTYYVTFNKT